jgi:hypothetical protein
VGSENQASVDLHSSVVQATVHAKGQPKMTSKVRHLLFTSCLLASSRRDDDYIYVGDFFRRSLLSFPFWKKRKNVTIKDRLIGNLLK